MTNEDAIIAQALEILEQRLQNDNPSFNNPATVKDFLQLKLAEKESEVFAVLFLSTKNQLLSYQEMFHGTLNGAAVHPREVVKEALKQNAGAIIIAHNHPSGDPEPSQHDKELTLALKKAFDLFEIVLLDHIIVGKSTFSFAENHMIP